MCFILSSYWYGSARLAFYRLKSENTIHNLLYFFISHVTYFQLVSILNLLKDNFLALIKSATLAQKIAVSQVLCRIIIDIMI